MLRRNRLGDNPSASKLTTNGIMQIANIVQRSLAKLLLQARIVNLDNLATHFKSPEIEPEMM
jgi:hypothetical protein